MTSGRRRDMQRYDAPMSLFLDSFWRAVAYCLHPRIIGISLLPLVLLVLMALGLGYFFWEGAVNSVFLWLESTAWLASLTDWLTGMGLALGDYDRDGRLDVLKTHFADDVPALYHGLGRGLFEDAATATGLGLLNRYVEWGAGLPDLDNDGWPDVVYVTGHVYPEIEPRLPQYPHRGPRVVFRSREGRRFEDVTSRSGPGAAAPHSSRGAAFGDVDNDGDLDILVSTIDDRPLLLRNDSTGGHWMTLRLEGVRGNRSAIGAKVVIETGARRQIVEVRSGGSFMSHNDLRAHFGLGAATKVDRLTIRWPNGNSETAESLGADHFYVAREGAGVQPDPPPRPSR